VHPNTSAGPWSTEQLQLLDAAVELDIAVPRPDGALGGWTTVWVVCVGKGVFVRSWHRRDIGWFGRAVATGRARVRATGLETDVAVVDLGRTGDQTDRAQQLHGELFDEVDTAYRRKYGAYGEATVAAMVGAHARVTTLRLDRV
jgi:hypothetical protein